MKTLILLSVFSLDLLSQAMGSPASNSEEPTSLERKVSIPSGGEFDSIVDDILSRKNMKFEDLETSKKKIMDAPQGEYFDKLYKFVNTTPVGEILNDPLTLSYIMRPPSHLLMREGIAYTDSKYENRLYDILEDDVVVWRENLGNKKFYESGSPASKVLKGKPLLSSSPDVGILTVLDTWPGKIYDIRNALYRWEFKDFLSPDPKKKLPVWETEPRFIVTPNHAEGHETTLIHILDSRRVILTLFLDSSRGSEGVKSEFGAEMMKRFNFPNYYSFLSESDSVSKLTPAEQAEKNLIVDSHQFTINRTTPCVDVSHHIQLQKDDSNCVLYANNFSNAVSTLLGDKDIADKVYTLAQQVVANPQDMDSEKVLKEIFQIRLKQFLPQYYDEQGNVKSAAELKQYHMDLRWEISAKNIQAFLDLANAAKTS